LKQLSKRKIIITGGPTREWFDPIRFLSNASTGKMGVALADEASKLSGDVVFIHGPVSDSLLQNKKYRMVSVESTEDMLNAVLIELTDDSVLIMSAAPADYTPVQKSDLKIKKGDGEMSFELKRTPDILKNISKYREENSLNNLFMVGFAAETDNTEEYALGKLKSKGLNMICLNDVSQAGAGFGKDTNIMTVFINDGGRIDLPMQSKNEIAVEILKIVEIKL